jgi:hypothetical protein
MRSTLPDDPKGYFSLKRFLDIHCAFLNSYIGQVSPSSISAVNVQTSKQPGMVLAVVREFLLAITSDLSRAARIAISLASSGENVFGLPKSGRTKTVTSHRMLLFFKDVIAWALQEENIYSPQQLQQLWEQQLQSETPAEYLQVLLGVVYMVYLEREMKVSRTPYSLQDQRAAAANFRDFVYDIPKVCADA